MFSGPTLLIASSSPTASDISSDSKSVGLPKSTGVTPMTTTMTLQCFLITHQSEDSMYLSTSSSQSTIHILLQGTIINHSVETRPSSLYFYSDYIYTPTNNLLLRSLKMISQSGLRFQLQVEALR